MDACYSASFAPDYIRNSRPIQRQADTSSYTISTPNLNGFYSAAEVNDIKEPYVLVSACKAGERTTEFMGHGLFTQILLDVLENQKPTTYTELIIAISAEYRTRR